MGLIGAAYASQHHHYQHHSIGFEMVSHAPSQAHKVWSNIWEVLITEGTWLMLTYQMSTLLNRDFFLLLLLFNVPKLHLSL